ncbi:MAG TPA: hypothetical protein VFP20_07335 [Bacteroidales bacterium]|nr:hypothetical protein [Bacteroidales bacterium]
MKSTLKYIALTTLVLWALYGLLVFVLSVAKPEIYTPWLAFIPFFFTMLAAATFHHVVLNPNVKISVMLAVKTGKLLLTLFIILLYILLVKVQTVTFLLTFGAFFIIYLALETLIMVRVNKQNKIQNED